MEGRKSPIEKAAIFGVCVVGFWALCTLLKEKGFLKQVLQPLVLAFMMVGVMSLFVEWVEFPFKLMLYVFSILKTKVCKKKTAGGAAVPLLDSVELEEKLKLEWFEEVARAAVANNPLALQYAPLAVRNDPAIVSEAVEKDAQALWYASARLRDSKEVVAKAVTGNGLVLAAASTRLQGDSEVALKAVEQNGEALQFVNTKGHFWQKRKQAKVTQKAGNCTHSLFDFKATVEAEIPSNFLLRIIAVALTLAIQYYIVFAAVSGLVEQIKAIEWGGFSKGLSSVVDTIPEERLSALNITKADLDDPAKVQKLIQDNVSVGSIAGHLGGEAYKIVMQTIMCTIYTLIMLISPMAEISGVLDTVRSYFARKTASNLIYTVIAYGILKYLKNPLTPLIVIVTFFLSYIPEIGAFITCALPVPFFLLDMTITDQQQRLKNALIGLVAMIINKFAVGNGFEAVIMGMGGAGKTSGGERQKAAHTHPVLMIIIVLFGGTIWGATGTLFAVPATWLVQAYFQEECRLWEIHSSKMAKVPEHIVIAS
mmetsp:Transcript_6660/g.11370  ORF Transcript_6660/g.11370 Transcript_6660/m.11370 type:complete len:538 (+) Transcript_6660:107-1720(+)